jgi:Predicted O-methyltransferase
MSSSYNKSRDGISSSTNKIMSKRVSFFMFVSMFILVLLAYTRTFGSHIAAYDQHAISAPSSSAFNGNKHACYPKIGLRPLKSRDEIGTLLQEHGFKTGVEVGVKKGEFAKQILDKWSSCVSYTLVDLWDKQENYKDIANVASQVHEEYYKETLSRLELYKNKIQVYRMYSTEAAKKMVPNSLDFAYIDARHDYCGVMDDLKAYWPLIKPGGIMAGHDYNENSEIRGQDWGLCQDGTRNEMAVKGAVNDFFLPQGLTITVTYYREHNFMSWLVQKPLC